MPPKTTILLVDDDVDARHSIVRVLERKGYRVLEAGGPDEARSVAKEGAGEIDLVVLDVVLPGRDGTKVASELAEEIAQPRILFISGYIESELPERQRFAQRSAFLQKPFTIEELLDRIRELLD